MAAAPTQQQLSAYTIRQQQQNQQNQQISTPQQPLDSPKDPGNHHQQQISFSFQFPPPGSSTKSASASSFHLQAAALNQHQLPTSTTWQQHHISQPPARHPANQLLTLLPFHTHTMAARPVVVWISCDYILLLYFSLSYLHRDKIG